MKSASPALIALLAQNQIIDADLYTLTLLDGSIYRFTNRDFDLSYGGHIFTSTNLIFARGNIKCAIGMKVDNMTLTVNSGASNLMSGLPFLQFAHNGGLDGARLLYQRAFMPADAPTDTSAGVLHGFEGTLQINELTRDTCSMEVRSDMELANVMMPRLVYQAMCANTLFDAGCGLTKSAFDVAGSVASSNADPRIVVSDIMRADGYFNGGTLRFNSGENAGALCTVLNYAGGIFTLMRPLVGEIGTGNTLTASPGCARSTDACTNRFANLNNFRGQPFIPTPEASV